MTWRGDGCAGAKDLARRVLRWQVGWRWYLVALLLPAVVFGVAAAGRALATGIPLDFGNTLVRRLYPQAAGVPTGLLIVGTWLGNLLVGGPLNEEIGWRGYALPRLQARHGPLRASLVLGGFWGLWHLPLFLVPGTSQSEMSPPSFLLQTVALTVVFTWLANQTRGSVLLAMLLHASFNTTAAFAPIAMTDWYATGVWLATAALLAVPWAVRLPSGARELSGAAPVRRS